MSDSGIYSADDLQTKLAEAEARASENFDRCVKLHEAFKRKEEHAKEDLKKQKIQLTENFVNDLIEFRHNVGESAEDEFRRLAINYGIGVIDPLGQKFDPEYHQAESIADGDGVAQDHIIRVVQKGYSYNGRLLRPAKVVVAK